MDTPGAISTVVDIAAAEPTTARVTMALSIVAVRDYAKSAINWLQKLIT
jgi:hypothetical protein